MNNRPMYGAALLRRLAPLAMCGALVLGPCQQQALTPDEQARLDAQVSGIVLNQAATVIGDVTFFLLDNLFVRLVN